MWVQDANREDLLNLVQSNRLDRPLQELPLLDILSESSSEFKFIWKEDPLKWGHFPSVIILQKMTPREFFAWTGTYLHHCRPFTAHCRIIHREAFQAAISQQLIFGLGNLETACIGLIIGETATYIAGQSDINRLSMTAFAGTYSFAITRALAGNLLPRGQKTISELWFKARRLTGQQLLSLSAEDLDQVWRVIFSISDHRGLEKWHSDAEFGIITSACHEILQIGEITETTWRNLTRGLFEQIITYPLLKGPREERVLQVEHALSILSQQITRDKLTLAFIGGYLASRIAPGTFEHHELLSPYLSRLPSILLWYGLCAGLPNDSKLRNLGFGIGRRIIRDAILEDNILNRPKCDISLEELEVLSSGSNVVQSFHSKESGHLVIEILPYINSTMRNIEVRHTEANKPFVQQALLSGDNNYELFDLLASLDRSLNSVDRVRDRISEIIGYNKPRKTRNPKRRNNEPGG